MNIRKMTIRLSVKILASAIILITVIGCILVACLYEVEENTLHKSDLLVSEDFIVLDILEHIDLSRIKDTEYQNTLMNEMMGYGYALNVELNDVPLFSSFGDDETEAIVGTEKSNELLGAQPVIYQRLGTTVVQQPLVDDDNNMYICSAVALSIFKLFGISSYSFYAVLLLLSFASIVVAGIVIMSLSIVFTNSIVKKLTTPLQLLSTAAVRIGNDDFSTDIDYHGISEFENVCDAVNGMQHKLSESMSKRLEEFQARNVLIAGITHDIKTPLTAITGYIKGIMDGVAQTPEMQRKYLMVIFEKAKVIDRLIEMMLLLVKLELNMLPLNIEHIDIKSYITEFVDSLNDAGDTPCTVECDVLDSVFADIDVMQMNRTLTNIINNSVKYANAQHLVIKIGAYEQSGASVISIRDNGTGIEAEHIGHIFESFYRADNSRSNGGSGLGLAIAKGIVELHGGEISAKNDNGLLIEIKLPLGQNNLITGEN